MGVKKQVQESILGRPRAAREYVNSQLDSLKVRSGVKVVSTLRRCRKYVKLTDSSFDIEIAFFEGLQGKDGAEALFQHVRDVFPDKEKRASLSDVLKHLQTL